MEYFAAFAGWRARRCQDCNTRFLQRGAKLLHVGHLKHIRKSLLLTAAAVGGIGVVLAAMLYFGHTQSASPVDGMIVPL